MIAKRFVAFFSVVLASAVFGQTTSDTPPPNPIGGFFQVLGKALQNLGDPVKSTELGVPAASAGNSNKGPWADKTYLPDQIDKYVLFREGIAMVNCVNGMYCTPTGAAPVLSTSTCDAAFLFSVVANKPLTKSEMEACAMQLYALHKNTGGEARQIADAFVKKEVIEQFTKLAFERMTELKKTKFFYMRSTMVKVDPVNPSDNLVKMFVNVNLNRPGDESNPYVSYQFDDVHLMRGGDKYHINDVLQFSMRGTPELAREAESARASGRFSNTKNIIKFEVVGAEEVSRDGVERIRKIKIQIKEFLVSYVNSKNEPMELGF